MKFLGLSLMIFGTGSLMSMQEDNKKQYFIVDSNYRTLLPEHKDTIKERLNLSESAHKALLLAYRDAEKCGKGQVLFKKNKQQFLAKISLIRTQNSYNPDPNYLIEIKPWSKVKLFYNNQ